MSNEDTKDCARLPVVSYRYKVASPWGGEVMCWEPDGRKVLETFPLADHTDAQAVIAELRAENERLQTMSDNYCALLMDANQKLQAAQARGAVVLPEFREHIMHARAELGRRETSPFYVRQRLAQKLTDGLNSLNPAPATADSDVPGGVE